MGKPSIFSSKYEQQMRRRRINIILIILILISAAFFGGKYYLNKNNINITLFSKKKPANEQQIKQNVPGNKTGNTKINVPPQTNQQIKPQDSAQVLNYEYKTSNGITYKIEYKINGSSKEFVKLNDPSSLASYDISQDKKYIIFDDTSSNDIVIGDINGGFKKITKPSYTSVSTGNTYKKDTVLSANPQYVWSLKPHFTSDGRAVYISQLPYFKRQGEFYLWVVNLDGSGHRKVGLIGRDISGIAYEGYDSQGNLRVKSGGTVYYLIKGSNVLTK